VTSFNFSLQAADDPAPTAGWQTPGLDVSVVNGSNTVTIGRSGGTRFFRLLKP